LDAELKENVRETPDKLIRQYVLVPTVAGTAEFNFRVTDFNDPLLNVYEDWVMVHGGKKVETLWDRGGLKKDFK